jgi:hypothetical protein
MDERATCQVCNSYSSSVLADINHGRSCRNCDCPCELLDQYQGILLRKETYLDKKISSEILKENEDLLIENMKLKTKISKMQNILGWGFDSKLRDSITDLINIVNED